MEHSNREEREEADSSPAPEEEESVQEPQTDAEATQSDDWWRATASDPDWTETANEESVTEVLPRKDAGTADVYFCGHTNVLSLNRALRAIAKEKLTGLLRSYWDEDPIDLLARDGEIVLVTTRDPDLYCPETPDVLSGVDVVMADRARDNQRKDGTPFLLTLLREESIARDSGMELIQQYGQKLFSNLWTAPRAWIMFEKNPDLLSEVGDIPGHPDVSEWALETLRLAHSPDQPAGFDPASIPAFTKDGLERVQKLKLNSDEAQFASQFNGARSVQQIAKNLRLDLKSVRQLLFRFLALEIVECWAGSTAAKPQGKSIFQRLRGSRRRD
ncbi:MAG TPA: hypothetical protein VH254_01135 [Candidatus Udaeobacter sp.]|jgi:hypothetical protein|nr:hypothetical protein [Candidatus Udaeobacter sp.]